MTELENKLFKIRKSLGLTQEELSKKVGHNSRQYISDIEQGKTKPSFEFIMKLKEMYYNKKRVELDLDALFDENISSSQISSYTKVHDSIYDLVPYYDEIQPAEYIEKDLESNIDVVDTSIAINIFLGSSLFADVITSLTNTINYLKIINYYKEKLQNTPHSKQEPISRKIKKYKNQFNKNKRYLYANLIMQAEGILQESKKPAND
ncbi:MAG: helix-turn-helix transcriptional regulator [Clostridia bacterium]|nr:helix-turn-helix transcriptional regulator [Clostridia bacterium]